MLSAIKNKNDLRLEKAIDSTESVAEITKTSLADPQVKVREQYPARRSYETAYKLRILAAYDACENASERGALLRKEGLYHSRINAWKQQSAHAKSTDRVKKSATLRTDRLTKENDQLKKQLAQAEAIIDLQKKVSELFTAHILPHKNSEEKS